MKNGRYISPMGGGANPRRLKLFMELCDISPSFLSTTQNFALIKRVLVLRTGGQTLGSVTAKRSGRYHFDVH